MRRQDTSMREAIALEKRVVIGLYRLATSPEERTVANLIGEHMRQFAAVYGFPQGVGTLDGCHIERVDSNRIPLYVASVVPWYLATEFQRLFRLTRDETARNLTDRSEASVYDLRGGYLLGDSAYPLQPWLLTPYKCPSKNYEEAFNSVHSQQRVIVEGAFGLPKNCFGLVLYDPRYMQRVAASGRTTVSVWSCITKDGLGPLICLEGKLSATKYAGIIDDVSIPHLLDGPFPEGDYIFQHDRSPIHTAGVVSKLLEELGVTVLDWPPQSPDLNIVENAWGSVKSSLAPRHSMQGLSEDGLWSIIRSEWHELRKNTALTESLYASLPSRMGAVITATGDVTRY
ncbi:uncharacterized protein LOC144120274 [Amblyomma americanum]